MGQWVVPVLGLEPLHLRVTLAWRMRWLPGYLTGRPGPRRGAGSTAGRGQAHEGAVLYCAAGGPARARSWRWPADQMAVASRPDAGASRRRGGMPAASSQLPTAQVLGERMPGGQPAWTGGGLAPRDPPGQRRFSVTARIDPGDRRGHRRHRLGVSGGLPVAGIGAGAAPVGPG